MNGREGIKPPLRKKLRNSSAYIKEVPSPDCTALVAAYNTSFIKPEACPTPIGGVDVAFEVI